MKHILSFRFSISNFPANDIFRHENGDQMLEFVQTRSNQNKNPSNNKRLWFRLKLMR